MPVSVEVTVEHISKGEKEVLFTPTGNRMLDQLGQSHTEISHVVELLVVSNDGTTFRFRHEVHPVTTYEDSVEKAQKARLEFAVALQKRLNHPIQ